MDHYQIVKEVINEWDPKYLLRYTSEDEYDREISLIVSLLPTVTSVEELAVVIQKVFDKMFSVSEAHSINNCYPSALKIWNKVNNKFPNVKKRHNKK
ncbi:DUF1871 family protein [Psychrobacillus sp.]|uniref:DUF1871 family protein n=1 Tax=Psychrobacillus sp. TaxID=1871623 RepID=UPI0028BE54B9|nr:DUF1871 family protein [Psychrobacillus sp.]